MKILLSELILTLALANLVHAEPLVLPSQHNNLSLSIYNQNVALVKDIRSAKLNSGDNEVIFDGVAQKIQSETAIIFGEGIKVREQNYSYNLMSYTNFLSQYIGKEVIAVRTNPEDGQDRYETVRLIGTNGSQPILQTRNGIDAEFPGRIMFDKVPAGMSNKPTLTAKLNVDRAGDKNLNLAYLTDGLNWKTDYVANVISPREINLTGWVTITNESGIDYENAKIQLIAGNVNVARAAPRHMKSVMLMANAASYDTMAEGIAAPENLNSYELYTLPTTATLKNQQAKQIALIERKNVKYLKEFRLNNPLFFGNIDENEFEKLHPAITYVIENTANSNLGISLPAGTVRFYQNDKGGNLQFIGSSYIPNTAKEDTARLALGEAFNISVSGKITKSAEKELSRQKQNQSSCFNVKVLKTFSVFITVNNAEDIDNTVIIEQNFPRNYKITKENIKGKQKNASTYIWEIPVTKNSKETLNYMVEIPEENRKCL